MNLSDRIINPFTTPRAFFTQGERSNLSYTIDYTAYLNGDVIIDSVWECKSNVALTPSSTATTTTVKVQGTAGAHVIVNRITTSAGETDERTIVVKITAQDATGEYR